MKAMANGLSEMTLGTVQLGLNYGIANTLGKPGRDTAYAMLQTASDCGINSLDTAQGYGDAESIIGDYFRRSPGAKEMIVTTKIALSAGGDISEKTVERELTEKTEFSLMTLGVKQLRYLLLHHGEDMYKAGGAVNRVMEKLVKRGYAQEAGVSVYAGDEILEMLKHPHYTAVQLPLSVLDQKLIDSGLLEKLESQRVCVFVRSVFSQGLIFLDPDKLTKPALHEYALTPLKNLRKRCGELGLTPSEYALSFVRRLQAVTSIVLGADSPEQIAQNAALFDKPPMDDSEFDRARSLFGSVPFDRIMDALR